MELKKKGGIQTMWIYSLLWLNHNSVAILLDKIILKNRYRGYGQETKSNEEWKCTCTNLIWLSIRMLEGRIAEPVAAP